MTLVPSEPNSRNTISAAFNGRPSTIKPIAPFRINLFSRIFFSSSSLCRKRTERTNGWSRPFDKLLESFVQQLPAQIVAANRSLSTIQCSVYRVWISRFNSHRRRTDHIPARTQLRRLKIWFCFFFLFLLSEWEEKVRCGNEHETSFYNISSISLRDYNATSRSTHIHVSTMHREKASSKRFNERELRKSISSMYFDVQNQKEGK